METKRKALGKGLEELFNMEPLDINKLEQKIVEETPIEEIKLISLKELRSNPYQPRKNFDEEALEELANSIKEHGVFQPIIVKKSIKGYDIIAGERRVKASLKAGLEKIPAIIRNFSDVEMMELALIENLQREDLSAIEEAEAYSKMLETMRITQEELSKRVGKSRSHITNMLGLLRLPNNVQEMVLYNKISMGHARVLSKLEDKEQITKLANKVVAEALSVRQLEELTISDNYKRKMPISKKRNTNEYIHVEEQLREKLGTKVKIANSKIEISFSSYHDLNRILDIIGTENNE
ncbi:MAG: ParB/RepB/Spo0J family partition protein [Bacilli bacterium]|nr:ParB/RepB/Spo0J family partition protein [Bacilli bacterium]